MTPDIRRASEKLREIVEGLDGVTDGPWTQVRGNAGRVTLVRSDKTMIARQMSNADAKHFARLDPDTLREIADAFKAMEARIGKLETELAVIGDLIEGYDAKDRATRSAAPPKPQGKSVWVVFMEGERLATTWTKPQSVPDGCTIREYVPKEG